MAQKTLKCDVCDHYSDVHTHVVLKTMNLCEKCRSHAKDDNCPVDQDCPIDDMIETLGEANDLLMCLYLALENRNLKNFDSEPHMTLLSKVGSHINYVIRNLNDQKE